MKVNTAELKNNLSRYLRRIRETGDSLTICERNRPIARIVPLAEPTSAGDPKARERQELMAKAERLGIDLRLPAADRPMREVDLEPETAEDGRTDVATIEWVRGQRAY